MNTTISICSSEKIKKITCNDGKVTIGLDILRRHCKNIDLYVINDSIDIQKESLMIIYNMCKFSEIKLSDISNQIIQYVLTFGMTMDEFCKMYHGKKSMIWKTDYKKIDKKEIDCYAWEEYENINIYEICGNITMNNLESFELKYVRGYHKIHMLIPKRVGFGMKITNIEMKDINIYDFGNYRTIKGYIINDIFYLFDK